MEIRLAIEEFVCQFYLHSVRQDPWHLPIWMDTFADWTNIRPEYCIRYIAFSFPLTFVEFENLRFEYSYFFLTENAKKSMAFSLSNASFISEKNAHLCKMIPNVVLMPSLFTQLQQFAYLRFHLIKQAFVIDRIGAAVKWCHISNIVIVASVQQRINSIGIWLIERHSQSSGRMAYHFSFIF